ncbi:MAG: fatty acid desaturase [Spirochaetaceae bacterium]|nr:fatty acid desaturase [Spirochaetaceae bacterium]
MSTLQAETQHRPLAEVRKSLRIGWYRCPIEPATLRRLMQRSDLQGWLQAGGHLLLFLATGTLTYLLFANGLWLGFALALFAHGTVGAFFKGLATHELGHGTVFRSKWLNRAFLRLFGVIAWHNHHIYAVSHTYHHRYTLYPDGDRELVLPQNPMLKLIDLFQLFVFLVWRGHSGLIPVVVHTVKIATGNFNTSSTFGTQDDTWVADIFADLPKERRKAINWARLTLLFHVCVIAVAIAMQWWLLPVLVTLTGFLGKGWSLIVGLPMHCGLRDNVPDFRKCVRSITLDPISTFLYWRMNWHTEHHMYAGVPCYNLKKLYREIAADMPRPRTLAGAWREMRDTWRRQQQDPGYQFDTPVPQRTAAAPATDNGSDELTDSIGDLAPETLATAERT